MILMIKMITYLVLLNILPIEKAIESKFL